MNRREFLISSLAAVTAARPAYVAAESAPNSTSSGEFLTDIPAYAGNVLLARPTDRSIVFSVFNRADATAQVEYRASERDRVERSPTFLVKAGEPQVWSLEGLSPDTPYEYRLLNAQTLEPLFPEMTRATFRTARKPGSEFTFTIQADSHLDDGCRTDIYTTTLRNQLADRPDFMIDMGDMSMAGKHPSRESALKQFLAQRYYFGLVGHSIPSFLVVGNHDGEEAKRGTDANSFAVWSNRQRKRYFPNPEPGQFYGGNEQAHADAGPLQNYYAWTWGDALFVVLDPYWTSTASRGNAAGWNMSLGKGQYDWLAATLRTSKAKHKLLFIHQLVGGLDDGGRGGAEAADCFEWGGRKIDGTNAFAEHRPGWPMPIHQLCAAAGVKAVFHGHDHFFARQEKDGIVYQLVPQAAHRNYRSDHAQEYGYTRGEFLPNSGHLRVRVAAEAVRVEYVRSVPATLQRRQLNNRDVAARGLLT